MVASKRQRILEALKARLREISVENGYATNAGDHIFLGSLPNLGPDDPAPCLAIVPGDDAPGSQQAKVMIDWPIDIYVVASVDLKGGDPWVAIEDGIADVKQAIELEDRGLREGVTQLLADKIRRAPVRTMPRESGFPLVGAMVGYVAPYWEVWGAPRE